MNDLTKIQTRRQDLVDNAIYNMLNTVFEDLKPQDTSYGWSTEDIAAIRDIIFPILKSEYYGKKTGFIPLEEMDFYPFIEDDEDSFDRDWCDFCQMSMSADEEGNCPRCGRDKDIEASSGDYTECQSCQNKITWQEFGECAGLCKECIEKIN